MTPALRLHDVHAGSAPAWWPPAPGWWVALALVGIVLALLAWWRIRRRRRDAVILRLFDLAVADAGSPSRQVAAMSELLRRAARRKDAGADTLDGEDWLRCLDEGLSQSVFSAGAGALLRDGGFRTDVAANEVDALRVVARARFLDWMRGA